MKINLTLSKQGFILIGVPLVFELLFIAILLLLLRQVEMQADREARSNAITQSATNLGNMLVQSGSALLMSLGSISPDDVQKYRELNTQVANCQQRLETLVKGNKHEEQLVASTRPVIAKTQQIMQELLVAASTDPARQVVNLQFLWPELEHQMRKLEYLLVQVILEEQKISGIKSTAEEKGLDIQYRAAHARQALKQFLIVGVALNVLIAVALALAFNKGTRSRLAILMDNTNRLARAEALAPALEGLDEIARLDNVFHTMADALTEAARKERAVVDNALDVICSIDHEGKFARVNPAAEESWGYKPEDLIGQTLLSIVPEEEQPKLARIMDKLKTDATSLSFEGQLTRKEGTIVDVLWSAHWSESDNALFCVAHDVTERKELERLKKEFVAMITHDLRSPLTGILFSTGLITEGAFGELSDQLKEELTTVEKAVEQMLRLINDLLLVEKLEAGKMQMFMDNVPLTRVLERSVKPLRSIAEFQKVKMIVPATTAEVYADEDKLARVMVNLVSNALKFSPHGGEIRLSIEEKDGSVKVQVSDQGPGIPSDKQESIFERFKQVDEKGKKEQLGTGLGLAICKEIIERHEGEIGVLSEVGKGSTFWFTIASARQTQVDSEQTARSTI